MNPKDPNKIIHPEHIAQELRRSSPQASARGDFRAELRECLLREVAVPAEPRQAQDDIPSSQPSPYTRQWSWALPMSFVGTVALAFLTFQAFTNMPGIVPALPGQDVGAGGIELATNTVVGGEDYVNRNIAVQDLRGEYVPNNNTSFISAVIQDDPAAVRLQPERLLPGDAAIEYPEALDDSAVVALATNRNPASNNTTAVHTTSLDPKSQENSFMEAPAATSALLTEPAADVYQDYFDFLTAIGEQKGKKISLTTRILYGDDVPTLEVHGPLGIEAEVEITPDIIRNGYFFTPVVYPLEELQEEFGDYYDDRWRQFRLEIVDNNGGAEPSRVVFIVRDDWEI